MIEYKIGDYYEAIDCDPEDGEDTTPDSRWLFKIMAIERRGKDIFALAAKCDWRSKRPILDDGGTVDWFDKHGKCQKEFHGVRFLLIEKHVAR